MLDRFQFKLLLIVKYPVGDNYFINELISLYNTDV